MTLFVTACGDDEENPCAGVTCERGVCSAGQCVNSASCGGEDDNCLDGYACTDADVCEARIECTDDSVCGGGLCENGACVNPAKCAVDDNCVPGDICIDEVCEADPCGGCDRGVCDVASATCVDSDVCTAANEDEVCLDGSKCIQQSCQTEEEFCNALDCGGRGVCSFEDEACVNADDCGGDDASCLEGFYCDANNACAENNCAGQNECTMGVCDRASGDCVNADPCSSAAECTDGFVCVDNACVTNEEACDPTCTGNQECVYDSGSLSATCEENPEGCTSALDCTGDRVCDAGACADPTACTPDDLESNDVAADATVFADAQTNSRVSSVNICGGDTDLFTFDTTTDPDGVGTLIADVTIVNSDVGLGVLDVEITNSSGTVVASGSTVDNGTATQSVAVEYTIDGTNGGVYTVSVADSGDVTTAGVGYSLTIDVVDPALINACSAPEDLEVGTPFVGTTAGASSTALTSSCGDGDGSLSDSVHRIEIDEASYVTFQLVSSPGVDHSISVRGACPNAATELADACADGAGTGGAEALSVQLEPGVYTVLVQSVGTGADGGYTLNTIAEPIICSDADNSCLDAQTANVCNEAGTAFDMVTCDNGCDSTAGRCATAPGDVCESAVLVDPNVGFSGTIDLGTVTNAYTPATGAGSCIPSSTFSPVDGEDYVFTTTVPAGDIVIAEIGPSGSAAESSIYIVTDCGDIADSCLTGVNADGLAGTETASWKNEGSSPQQVFIIYDTEDFGTPPTPDVEITVSTPICTPGERRCVLNRESQRCNDAGTAFDSTTICSEGCDASTGECTTSNDTCTGAIDLTPAGGQGSSSASGSFNDFSDTNQPGGACAGSSFSSGLDAVYLLSGVVDNAAVTVSLTSDDDTVVYARSGPCNNDSLGACVGGADNEFSGTNTETFTFIASSTEDYYLVADLYSASSGGSFTIDVDVVPPACTPGQTIGCNTANDGLEYCDSTGQIATLSCTCDPVTNTCDDPQGQICSDAIPLTGTAGMESGNWPTSQLNSVELTGRVDNCGFDDGDSSQGPDTIYRIDLQAGETFNVEFLSGSTSGVAYIQETCGATDSCYGVYDEDDSNISYYADTTRTVYLVLDSTLSSSTLGWDFNWEVVTGNVCAPNSSVCFGPNTVRKCGATGGDFVDYTCANGCSGGTCNVDTATANTCGTATNVGNGGTFYIDADDFTGDADPESCADGDGPDAFYAVTASALDIIRVTGASLGAEVPSVYLFSDCADIDGSCLAGAEGSSSYDSPAVTQFQVQTAGTYYVGFDSTVSSYDEGFIYSVEVLAPECLPSDLPFCNVAGDGVNYCVGGLISTYDCSTTCTGGTCDDPQGDTCFDTIPLASGGATSGSVSGDWADVEENWVNAGEELTGACVFDDVEAGDGLDVIYSIDLAAGETLEATVDPDGELDITPYILSDCAASATSCVAADPFESGSGDPATVAYLADVPGTYFLVIDRSDTSSSGSYTIDWTVTSGLNCAPNQYSCVDATTAGLCNSDGTGFEKTFPCLDSCNSGACTVDVVADDACSTARTISTDQTFVVYDASTGTDDSNLSSSSCVGEDTPGNDFFYRVDLAPNEILDLKSTSVSGDSPAIYIFSDCADPEASCLAGAAGTLLDSPPAVYEASTSYQNGPTARTVIIALDSEFSSNDEPFFVEVGTRQPNCTPGQFTQVCTTDDSGFEYCNDAGFITEYDCADAGGGAACSNGACVQPRADVCLDPEVLVPDGTGLASTTGVLGDVSDDFDLETGNICTASITPGNDAVYAVDLTAGQVLTADLISTEATAEDLALYLTTDCDGLPNSCVGDTPGPLGALGSDTVGIGDSSPESVTYTAAADERIYLIVDSFYSNSAGGYSLSIDVQ